ncbi:MAG: radical SAM protein [Euryarchaeota archaeon]|nr:radical SAM protein [Euryarchaeota archaeon]
MVSWFVRPDALTALEGEGVKGALGRYAAVCRDERAARFLVVKSVPIKVSLDGRDKDLWAEHDARLGELRAAVAELDAAGKEPRDLPGTPGPSMMDLKLELANRMLRSCRFCERRCGADRTKGKRGFCNLDRGTYLSTEFIHMGEEGCFVPSHTFFFIGCTFYCVFCQNWTVSRQVEKGAPVTGRELAALAKRRRLLEKSRNINLVGGEPTPNLHTILDMLAHLDTNVPVLWNSNMYMSSEAMRLLDGCVDVYLADFKYGNDACGWRLSKVRGYWEVTRRNHLLAKDQAEVLIRHLVMPNHLECCTRPILQWIAEHFGNTVRLNIMAQYRPEFEALDSPDIGRRVSAGEVQRAFEIARELGLTNLDL